jgi:3-hydroxyisobutyrate dehydrogenase
MKIGFIGLGIMGSPMAGHLHRAGHELYVYDIQAAAIAALVSTLGNVRVTACSSPLDLAPHCELVITMLPNGQVVQEVVLGKEGLLTGMKAGSLLMDTSSAEPWLTLETGKALQARGIRMVDAPVSGAQWGAQEANLVFMVGAQAADLEQVRPILALMGPQVFHLGGPGSGHAMKCINNTITAMTMAATSEGLLIGKKYGLNPSAMVDVLNTSTGMSWVSQTHFKQRIINRTFDDPFKLALMLKDIGIAMDLSRGCDDPPATPMMALGEQLWKSASRAAGPQASVSEFVRWSEGQSGATIS